MYSHDAASERSVLVTSLVDAEGVPYGREDSFKMSRASLLTQRFLIGVRTEDVPATRILQWCDKLGMSPHLRTVFEQQLPEANMVGVGLEDGGDHLVYKMYLEFWDKIRLEFLRTRQTDPRLLHLGFKWRAHGDGSDARIARYTCFPLLSLHDTLQRMATMYPGAPSHTALELSTAIVRRAAMAAPATLFLYLETSEQGSSRTSFDINLYKSELRMTDIDSLLRDLTQHYGISDEQFSPLMTRIGCCRVGHLSGGVDRSGNDVTTLYYETRSLEP